MIRGQMMKVEGYKISGYDATYRKALFNVTERSESVLEITDLDSGTTLLVDFDSISEQNRRTSVWTERREKKQGQTIHFGRMGFFEELEYNSRKKEQKK